MAEEILVAGLASVYIGGEGAAYPAAMSLLGFTRNGAEISATGYFLDVPGDEHGGDDGPPIDVQYMGEIASVRLELTKWDLALGRTVESRRNSGTGGSPGTAGALMFGGVAGSSLAFRVLVNTATAAQRRNFLRCFPRNVIEINKGTRFSTLVVEFEAHAVNGVLWNTTA